ncbi:MAG TPA: PEP/pyruvate-binding domain-containing protein, partial [Acidimicrobiales bacterium]|nr:PEP/pyruvate-binding domain-containing protein [Acidimicrobiales bacterium]
GRIVMGAPGEAFEAEIKAVKLARGLTADTELTLEDLQGLASRFKEIATTKAGVPFPEEPAEQLEMAIRAVFDSWNGERATIYRRRNKIADDLGTAVNVVAMVFGNVGEDSGSGVAFTRDASTGERKYLAEYLTQAQGEDVVSGARTPLHLDELKRRDPASYRELVRVMDTLEAHYRDMCDIEFTVEQGKLWLLQTRIGKRTAAAAVKIAVDLVKEKKISKEEAVLRVDPAVLDQLLHPQWDPDADVQVIAKGLNASPGAAAGRAVFDAGTAMAWAVGGERVILVRPMTDPDDVGGMYASQGILTSHGGKTSHAAVVARGAGKPAVCGAEMLTIDIAARR